MATFWEIAALSAEHMFSLYFDYFNINYSPFWFRSGQIRLYNGHADHAAVHGRQGKR